MKKIVCGCFGTIYYAQILKNGMMSSENRVDVTDDALLAVLQSLMCETEYIHQGFYGYQYDVGNVPINLVAYDTRKYKLVRKDEETE